VNGLIFRTIRSYLRVLERGCTLTL